MVHRVEVQKRLLAVIQREGTSPDRERMAEWTIRKIAAEIMKIIEEEVRQAKRENQRHE